MNDLSVRNNTEISNYNPQQVLEQVKLIQDVMKSVMKEGEHYGLIEGCGDKKSLYKSGAEKLGLTFRFLPKYTIVTDELNNGHKNFTITCTLLKSQSNDFIGEGVGSACTMESKFRYRNVKKASSDVVPRDFWDAKKAENKELMKRISKGRGTTKDKETGIWYFSEVSGKEENADIADTYNTVLKIAKKRAFVDAIISATACSDIFAQDIEDIAQELKDIGVHEAPQKQENKPDPQTHQEPPKRDYKVPESVGAYIPFEDEDTGFPPEQSDLPPKNDNFSNFANQHNANAPSSVKKITPKQLNMVFALLIKIYEKMGIKATADEKKEDFKRYIETELEKNVGSLTDLTINDASDVIGELKNLDINSDKYKNYLTKQV